MSRQTVSNWENDRSYPDIAGVLALAKLYGLSLDELLREDEGMLRHLEESTNIVKSKRTLSRRLLMAAYLVIWGVSIAFFWVGTAPTDAMGYGLVFLWFLIPVATMVVAFFVGRDEEWREVRWLMLLFFGAMYMLAPYATFSLANTLHSGNRHWPELTAMLPGSHRELPPAGVGGYAAGYPVRSGGDGVGERCLAAGSPERKRGSRRLSRGRGIRNTAASPLVIPGRFL